MSYNIGNIAACTQELDAAETRRVTESIIADLPKQIREPEKQKNPASYRVSPAPSADKV